MYKRLEFYPGDYNGVEVELIHPGVMVKTAEISSELKEFIDRIKIENSKVYILVNALGAGEFYGCFFKGQKVMTENGYKNIEDISENDLVLTHKKRFRKVLKTFDKEYSGEKINIKLQNRPEAQESTKNHPYWVIKKEVVEDIKKSSKDKNIFIDKLSKTEPVFVDAENLTPGDYVLVPHEYEETISKKIEDDFAYLYGYYLSGGCLSKRYDKTRNNTDEYENIIFVMNLNGDVPMIEKLEQISKKYDHILGMFKTNSSEKTCRLELHWKKCASELYRLFGNHSTKKYIHPEIFNQSREWKLKFIAAYLDGDGHITSNSNNDLYENTIKFSTVSKTLALDLQRLLASIGIISTVSLGYNKNENGCFGHKDNKIYECSIGSSYTKEILEETLRLKPLKNIKRTAKNGGFYILNNGYMLMKIKEISSEYTEQTKYNLEVEEDNTYVVDFIGHNSNRNGDFIGEPVLQKYYKQFEENGHVFKHHKNKNLEESLGKILFSHYNPNMHRIELVCELDKREDEEFIKKIEDGEYPAVSMGMRTPYDVCLAPDTDIFSTKPNTTLKDIEPGNYVYTRKGHTKKVLNKYSRVVDEHVEIKPFGDIDILKGSVDHPMLIAKKEQFMEGSVIRRAALKEEVSFSWDKLEDCKIGDYLVFNKTKKTDDYLTLDQTTILGYFISGGSYIKERKVNGEYSYQGISFSFNLNELETHVAELKAALKRQYNKDSKIYIDENKNSVTLTFRSKNLVNLLLEQSGEYSDKKFIHPNIFTLKEELILNLLGKLINGDGSQDHNIKKGMIRYTTISKQLAKGVRRLALEVGIPASINVHDGRSNYGNTIVYNVCIPGSYSKVLAPWSTKIVSYEIKNGTRYFPFEDYILIPISEKYIKNESLEVLNLQVEDDETYQANGYVVHNCSICGHKSKRLSEYCFIPNTMITMYDGTYKLIKDIEVGDLILSSSGEPSKVIKVFDRNVDEELVNIKHSLNNFPISCTLNHPVLSTKRENNVEKTYVEAGDLREGDFIYSPKIKYTEYSELEEDILKGYIKNIKPFNYKGKVYNIETEDGSYIANGIIVHNCDHLKYHMNDVYSDGRKVYAINPAAKFFDISFVVIPADVTAGVMKKIAGLSMKEQPKLSAELGEEFLRTAGTKEADLIKQVDTPAETQIITKDKYGRIFLSQPLIPKKELKAMAKEASLGEVCSTLMGMHIVPKPVDFQRLALYSMGHEKLAEALDKEKILLINVDEKTTPIIPDDLSLDNFNDKLAKKYAHLIPERAMTKPLVTARILEKLAFMSETPMEETGTIPPNPGMGDKEEQEFYLRKNPSKVREVFLGYTEEPPKVPFKNPVVATSLLSSLFLGTQKINKVVNGIDAVGKADAFLLRRPWMIPLLIGATTYGSLKVQKDLHKEASAKNILTGYLIAVPATYIYSGAQESKVRKGEQIGNIQNIIRKHPFLSSIVTGMGLGAVQKQLLKFSSRKENIRKVVSTLSDSKLDTLFNDVIN